MSITPDNCTKKGSLMQKDGYFLVGRGRFEASGTTKVLMSAHTTPLAMNTKSAAIATKRRLWPRL